jgi:hypothetical protein
MQVVESQDPVKQIAGTYTDRYSFKTRVSSTVASLFLDFRAMWGDLGEFGTWSSSAFTKGRAFVEGVSRRKCFDPREAVGAGMLGVLLRTLVKGVCFLGVAKVVRLIGDSIDLWLCLILASCLGTEMLRETTSSEESILQLVICCLTLARSMAC